MDEHRRSLQHPHAHPRPLATSLSLLVPLAVVVAFLLLVGGSAAGVLRWWLHDEAGSRWLLQRLPLVQVQGFSGTLGGERWQVDRLHVAWDQGRQSITVEGLDAQGLRWTWRPHEQAWLGLDASRLQARRVELRTGPPSAQPAARPASLALPLELRVAALALVELQVDGRAFTDLAADDLALSARSDGRHAVGRLQASGFGVRAEASGGVATGGDQPVQLQGQLRPLLGGDAPAWAAVVQAFGPLAALQAQATLRGVPRPGADVPALDARATLRPFEAWPLGALTLSTRELDLAALASAAPQTRLSGSARLAPRREGAPLQAEVDLANALPGRWNERRLPVVRLTMDVAGDVQQPDRLALPRFEAWLADAQRPAGRLRGSALWQGHVLQLDTTLDGVTPQRLDGRAAAMQLSGPVVARVGGLPTPSGRAAPASEAVALAWKVDLEGRLEAAPQPVRLLLEGKATDQRLDITQLRATSGAATAELRGVLQRAGRNEWKLETAGSLVDFDPLPWWPGDAGGAWRQGPHRLSAGWQLDLRLPGNAAELPTLELLQRLAGNGSLRVHDSLLAGVPLAADLRIGYTQAATPVSVLLRGEISLGGNQLTLDGRGDPTGNGQTDRWRAELRGDALSNLAPLARLHPVLADWVPRQGTASLVLAADGRWPNLRTEGQLRVSQLLMGIYGVASGQAQWRLDTAGDRALALKLNLAGLQAGAQRADHLNADVTGTLGEHRISVSGALPLRPPALATQVLGVQSQTGTRAQMQASGAWRSEASGGGRWRARIERLVLGSWDGNADDAPPASLWAQARDLQAELLFGAKGELLELQADAGRVQLADAAALRWDAVRADWRGSRPNLELRATVEPFALAPLMARAFPTMGFAGDITLGARVDIRAAEKLDAELVFERRDGDLHITSGDGTQLLGLTDLRLAVVAHNGEWTFTPLFKGRSLGEISGSVRVSTTPERRWPHADAALQGEVTARVADLGIWGAWVPPGWRLAGELRTRALLSGRFGEPRYQGEVTGSGLAVRNLLQGVNVSGGQVAIKLEGDTATIERFTLKGGDGTLALTGQASLGAKPEARLLATAERFRVIGRVDRMATASGQAELRLSREQGRLEGRIKLDEALYDAGRSDAPSLDEDVTVRRAGQPEDAEPEARAAGPRRNFALQLDVDMGDKTRVRGRGIDTGLRGTLRITNPAGRLDVRGTIATDDGTYAAYGQKLVLERGIVAFGGPPDDPRLDILALRANSDTRVGLAITGTAQTPRVRLFSEPEMSETEKLSWLLLGRAPDGLGRNDTALLQRAAVALLAGEGEAPTDQLLRNLGIDELGLKQSDGDVRETVVTLGKQLSRRWYLGYERGVNATTGTWQLTYRIAQRFTLRAQSGLENSLDAIWVWRFQETPADAGVRKSTATPP